MSEWLHSLPPIPCCPANPAVLLVRCPGFVCAQGCSGPAEPQLCVSPEQMGQG